MQEELNYKTPVSRLIIIIVTAILLMILGIIIGYYMSQGNVSNQVNQNGTGNIQTSSSSPTLPTPTNTAVTSETQTQNQAADEYAGWKTYTSDKYGFSFKYPNKYNLFNSTKNPERVTIDSTDQSNIEGDNLPSYQIEVITEKYDFSFAEAENEWLKNINDNGIFNNKSTDAVVGGSPAKCVEKYTTALGASNISSCLVINNGYKYIINMYAYGSDATFLENFFSIYSSFKFTK